MKSLQIGSVKKCPMAMEEMIQQHLVDARMSNDVSRPATVGICKREFGENLKMEERILGDLIFELDGKSGFGPVRYLDEKTPVEYGPLCSEKETRFIQYHSFDASLLEPLTAKVLVSTTNRGLLGRMVHEEAQIYLALPYIAAASASTVCVSRFM